MNETLTVSPPVNEALQTIYQRRAVRKYTNKPVAKELIEQIIDAGRMAPSAINKQPWRFYVLTKKAQILACSLEIEQKAEQFLHLAHGANMSLNDDFIFHNAPVVIFISAPKDNEWASMDVGMCAENMMLAAKSLGIDSCPVGLARFVEKTKFCSTLNIPENEHVLLAIILGYGDEQPEAKIRNRDNVFFIS